MGNEMTKKRSFRRWPPVECANYGDIKTRARRLLVKRSHAGESTTKVTQFVTRQSSFPSRKERIVFHGKLIPTNYSYSVTFNAGWRRFDSVLYWKIYLNMFIGYNCL